MCTSRIGKDFVNLLYVYIRLNERDTNNVYACQMTFEFMALKLFNSLPNSTKILDYGAFKSLIKRKLYEESIYTINEYFEIVQCFI